MPHNSPIRAAVFSPDGRYLIVAADSGAHLWEVASYRKIMDLSYGNPAR
jgi:WD40 repeat protein